ncbi:MAG: hypothetical protein H7Y01_15390 [Ferruginibacter sp.]|nr:hypothetical protein [Chitinophagaceae bacterium]
MDTNQPTVATSTTTTYVPPPSSTGMFGTKMPSSIAFLVAVLLFFMPFVDIKCNNMSLQQVSGLQLATGFKMKNSSADNSYLDDLKTDKVDSEITKATTNTSKKDPNLYALIAMGLGVLGLLLSLTNAKAAIGGAMVTGIASAGALIGMMLDVKKKVKMDMPDLSDKTPDNDVGNTLDKIGSTLNDVTDKVNITVAFTPWFYLSVIAFLAAAFFCYKRMSAANKR